MKFINDIQYDMSNSKLHCVKVFLFSFFQYLLQLFLANSYDFCYKHFFLLFCSICFKIDKFFKISTVWINRYLTLFYFLKSWENIYIILLKAKLFYFFPFFPFCVFYFHQFVDEKNWLICKIDFYNFILRYVFWCGHPFW